MINIDQEITLPDKDDEIVKLLKRQLRIIIDLLKASKEAEFDLRIRKQMGEELTPQQLSILKKLQLAITKTEVK